MERGWRCSYSWEEKGVEEPEQQEKPNHGNVSLALQTQRYLQVLLMEQQQSDGCKDFSSQGKTEFNKAPTQPLTGNTAGNNGSQNHSKTPGTHKTKFLV